MKWKIILTLSLIFYLFRLNSQVHNLSDIENVSMSQGNSLKISKIVTDIKIDGEDAVVTINFPNTAILSVGVHDLVFSAMTFSGKTESKVVSLIVNEDTPLTVEPVISGINDLTMTEGDRFNILKKVSSIDASGKKIPVFASITYPEHLAFGNHDIYYTAVDYDGNSKVVSAKIQVNQLEKKYKKAEWAKLGNFLFKKYFTPTEFNSDVADGISKYFTYSPSENGITAEILINGIKYNTFEINSTYPGKLERLTARMILFLNELKHHRVFWKNESNIIFSISERIYDTTEYDFSDPDNLENPGAMKSRGIYLFKIPVEIFRKDNAIEIICQAIKDLSIISPDVEIRTDNGGKITKQHIKSADGEKIIFMQDLGAKLLINHTENVEHGIETFEDTFDYMIFEDEWQTQYSMFIQGQFGTFTNPRLFINEEGE